jgi:hypothetical protein
MEHILYLAARTPKYSNASVAWAVYRERFTVLKLFARRDSRVILIPDFH